VFIEKETRAEVGGGGRNKEEKQATPKRVEVDDTRIGMAGKVRSSEGGEITGNKVRAERVGGSKTRTTQTSHALKIKQNWGR